MITLDYGDQRIVGVICLYKIMAQGYAPVNVVPLVEGWTNFGLDISYQNPHWSE